MSAPVAILLAGCAAVFGLMWPDFDQWLPLLTHRSIVTHGLWLPLAVALAARRQAWLAPVAAGLALGTAIHCAPDLFPKAMRGYAMIDLPFVDGFGRWLSWAWLAATVVIGIVVPLRWVEARWGRDGLGIAAAATAVLALAYFVLHSEPPEMGVAVGSALALAHPAARRVALARLLAMRRRPES
ncbi:hypothetical protein [Glacieibacterium frigidum]|uniref:Uncharacterized protein n=1 Tax=Glacieibacterium frigidum TaxID=2593303 RepID=A0A552UF48_9SPHN|nr:hypothetical protein [Glacieibacterium frigidum]TRW16824.1 hypothetical protein FMM06_01030 [Glacieibacterium frigidum]